MKDRGSRKREREKGGVSESENLNSDWIASQLHSRTINEDQRRLKSKSSRKIRRRKSSKNFDPRKMARNGRKIFTKNEKFKVQKRKVSQKINSRPSPTHPSTSVSTTSHPSSSSLSSQKTQGQENKSNGLYIEQRHNRDSVYVVRDRTDARQLCRVRNRVGLGFIMGKKSQ